MPDCDSMCGSSTLNSKLDYKAFKFSEKSQEMRALKRDAENNLEIHRQKADVVVEKVPQVNEFMAWRDRVQLQAAPCATSPSRTEGSKERKKDYTKKIGEDSDRPELVAFFQEHNYQFVKALFMDGEVPPLNKCMVENCEMDHKKLDSYVYNKSESTKGTQKIMSSLSHESKLRINNGSNKDVINKCESRNLKMEGEENTDARDVRLLDCCAEKIIPERQLIEKVASREAVFANSMVQSAIEIIIDNNYHDDNSHESNASSESEMESRSVTHNSDSPITTINGEEEFQQHDAYSQHSLEAYHASKPQDGMSETSPNQDSFQQHDQEESNSLPFGSLTGPTMCSEQTLCSGSISCQSNSSNACSNSFVFPILPSEWNGSPVRMAKADRRQLRKQRSWKKCFLCSKF